MHRSGTSLIGRLLDDLGLFSGVIKDKNNEAIFFQQLNKWLLSQCGGRWDMPRAMEYLWNQEELLSWNERYLRYQLESLRSIQFLGIKRFFLDKSIMALNQAWGWKDPCNTITLPMWLRLFPEAKVLYIERHGVDVAQSLLLRSKRGFAHATRKFLVHNKIAQLYPKRRGFVESPRCTTLEGGFSLWREYVDQASVLFKTIPHNRVLKIRYENLLEQPNQYLQDCAKFCGMGVSVKKLDSIVQVIQRNKAYSYRQNAELLKFAQANQSILSRYGY